MRSVIVIALGAALALVAWASTASAADLSMTFTEARANVGKQLEDDVLFEEPYPASFTAHIDPGSGEITGGVMTVHPFSTEIDEPIEAHVKVVFTIGEIAGHFDQATGELSLTGEAAGILTTGERGCNVSASELTLWTKGNSGGESPRYGAAFTAGLTGSGAIAGQWDDMTASPRGNTTEEYCKSVEDQIGGPGGIWLEHAGDRIPPAAPRLTGTDPASPNGSASPRILGRAEAGSTVSIFLGPG